METLTDFNYIPSPTGIQFHESDAFIKLVVGPFGSGKTCMIMSDAKFYCLSQNPAPDGVRYTRIGVVRGTYPELTSTTRDAIIEVFPKGFGTVRSGGHPLQGLYRFPVGDGPYDYLQTGEPWKPGYGTVAQVEFILQALQDAVDADKVRSANWSFAIVNEATSVDYAIIAAIMGRVGRYPSENMGGCSYAGILIDTNQPPQGHYLLDMIEHPKPSWFILRQPPAAFKRIASNGAVSYEINTQAENLRNLGAKRKPDDFQAWSKEKQQKFLHDKGLDYYRNQVDYWCTRGREDMVDSLFCMLDVPVKDGKPVFSLFNYDTHVLREDAEPTPYKGVICGYDTSGIHPACVFLQEQRGRWVVLDELYGEDMGMEAFLEQALMPLVTEKYVHCDLVVACDPANARDSYTGQSPSAHLEARGLRVEMPRTNDPKTRINTVESMLNKNAGGLVINPRCNLLITAMQGGYHYRRLRVMGAIEEAYDPRPEKNTSSHIADALQYACLHIMREGVSSSQDLYPLLQQMAKRREILRRAM